MRRSRGFLLLIAAGFTASLAAVLPGAAQAQSPTPARVEPAASRASDGTLSINVLADGVDNMGGYQFVLSWDSSLVKFVGIDNADLLGSSGRRAYCPAPVVDTSAVRLACVTFNPEGAAAPKPGAQAPGARGSGKLATARFQVLKPGKVQFHLSHVILVDPVGTELPSASSNFVYDVDHTNSSFSPVRMGMIAGGGLLALLLLCGVVVMLVRRRRRPGPAVPVATGRSIEDDGGQYFRE